VVGLKKEQALDMAKKLGFKDKLADEVYSSSLFNIYIYRVCLLRQQIKYLNYINYLLNMIVHK
jgi:hypothetical protein